MFFVCEKHKNTLPRAFCAVSNAARSERRRRSCRFWPPLRGVGGCQRSCAHSSPFLGTRHVAARRHLAPPAILPGLPTDPRQLLPIGSLLGLTPHPCRKHYSEAVKQRRGDQRLPEWQHRLCSRPPPACCLAGASRQAGGGSGCWPVDRTVACGRTGTAAPPARLCL